jgi:hypothetical protein
MNSNNSTISKTRRQWLEELPSPYNEQAIANAIACWEEQEGYIDKPSNQTNIIDSLYCAFDMDNSPEGGKYWFDLIDKLKEKE